MRYLLLTLAVSSICGFVAYKLKVPGGMLVGAVIGASVLQLLTHTACMPLGAKVTAQIIAGAFIGCTPDREDIKQIRCLCGPMLVMLLSLLLVNLLGGMLIYSMGVSDLLTCLLCLVPGGLSDVSLIASDMNADISIVVIFHFARMLAGVGLFPSLIVSLGRKAPFSGFDQTPSDIPQEQNGVSKAPVSHLLIVLATATAAGLLARLLEIPSGTLVFAILSTMLLKLSGLTICFPRWLKRCAQVLSGAYIGSLFALPAAQDLYIVAAGISAAILGYIINAILGAWIMARNFDVPFMEAMLILTPAGASDMALISADMGIMSTRLVLLQMIRLVTVTTFFPQLCYGLAQLF